jgi:adenosylcobinamide kinase/adenosylcobinamide-phosphate guanylyltransferase
MRESSPPGVHPVWQSAEIDDNRPRHPQGVMIIRTEPIVMKEFILGGTRSGKSAFAQRRAAASGLSVIYLATAQAGDAEMAERIARHRAERPGAWALVEEPLALAAALRAHAAPNRCLLVDCLTLWLSNLLATGDDALAAETQALLTALSALPGHLLLVSNEVGQGIVPANPLARRFRDEAGRLHQAVAQRCDRVSFVIAGLPLTLKDCPA